MRSRAKSADVEKILELIQGFDDYDGQIAARKVFEAKKARVGKLSRPLPDALTANLAASGIKNLYIHQVEAIEKIRAGRSVVVVTDTSSGKSLCYNLAVLEELILNRDAKALYLFPTKALSQDQARGVHQLSDPAGEFDETKCVHPLKIAGRTNVFGVYDGDTPEGERLHLRRAASIIITNPDMLSLGILPRHDGIWANFFRNLKFIVVDELHTYRGIFGSHVANLFRRVNRVCEYHGAKPVYVCCSATIANAGEHAGRLTDTPMELVENNGAPRGRRIFVLWNPPESGAGSFKSRSPITETTRLFATFTLEGLRTITFARAKPTVEVILRFTRDRLRGTLKNVDQAVQSYRGGYLPSERRKIERALAAGEILGVTCTNALELGVDIGSLDAAIINGYPGTIAGVYQQAGRAGRRLGDSIAVLVAYNEPLDQYFMRNPDYFFGQAVERAIINPDNRNLLEQHLRAAAYEIPLKPSEEPRFGREFRPTVGKLLGKKELKQQKTRKGYEAMWVGMDFPASDINLRTATSERYQIRDAEKNSLIGIMDASTAFIYLHEGAVYLHQGESWLVKELDLKKKIAWVTGMNLGYHTRALSNEDIRIVEKRDSKVVGSAPVSFGTVRVTSRVKSYKRVNNRDNSVLGTSDLDLPEHVLETDGFWFEPRPAMIESLRKRGLDPLGGLHAVEHAAISLLPVFAMCDRNDIGGVSTAMHPDTGGAVVFLHDAYSGGIGISETGYERVTELLAKTRELIADCRCDGGCPSCIQSPRCGNMNEPLDKAAAVEILTGFTRKSAPAKKTSEMKAAPRKKTQAGKSGDGKTRRKK